MTWEDEKRAMQRERFRWAKLRFEQQQQQKQTGRGKELSTDTGRYARTLWVAWLLSHKWLAVVLFLISIMFYKAFLIMAPWATALALLNAVRLKLAKKFGFTLWTYTPIIVAVTVVSTFFMLSPERFAAGLWIWPTTIITMCWTALFWRRIK